MNKSIAISSARHLLKAIGYASAIGTGFALLAMGFLFYATAIVGVIGSWLALYKIEKYFSENKIKCSVNFSIQNQQTSHTPDVS